MNLDLLKTFACVAGFGMLFGAIAGGIVGWFRGRPRAGLGGGAFGGAAGGVIGLQIAKIISDSLPKMHEILLAVVIIVLFPIAGILIGTFWFAAVFAERPTVPTSKEPSNLPADQPPKDS